MVAGCCDKRPAHHGAEGSVVEVRMDLAFHWSEKGRLCVSVREYTAIPGVAVYCDAVTP